MKVKAIFAGLVGAVALQGATAGEWCPPAAAKCPVEESPCYGSISVGYESDYLFYGARLAEDSMWADVNYTFDCLPIPITLGVWAINDLNADYGTEVDFYASFGLPSILGFDQSFGYTLYTYPSEGAFGGGPSQNEISYEISREIYCGWTASYRVAYDFNMWDLGGLTQGGQNGAWMHTIGIAKSWEISDCVALDFGAGVLYSDNYWAPQAVNGVIQDNTGWNNYYIQAALPMAVGCTGATLTPYVGYNGTPDGWVLDGTNYGPLSNNTNFNDLLHWGVSFGVEF